MDADEFRVYGKQMVDYIADYLENIGKRRVTPDVEPGYLRELIPKEPPKDSEKWEDILKDVETKIMPGITHWQHPRFHAYFPAGNSYPSILGDMLSSGLGIVGFSWASSPACTELETIILSWMGNMLGLSKHLLPFADEKEMMMNNSNTDESSSQAMNGCEDDEVLIPNHTGGGVLLGSASECVLVAMLSARNDILQKLRAKHPFVEDGVLVSKLVAYTSKLAHSCVEKAGTIAMVKMRLLDTDENYSLRGTTLEAAVQDDRNLGLIPFFVTCTLGTTSCCSFDNIQEVGSYCKKEDLYLHVDAAYAGSAFICEEFRHYMNGLEVKNKYMLTKALSVDPVYLRYKEMDKAIDYRHWGIALSRRFRSLKLWFTIRTYGIKGLQSYIREHVRLAKKFEAYILSDSRFEILGKVALGLVCFRLKGTNVLSQNLLFVLNDSGKIHMVPAMVDDKYIIRFCVNAQYATDDDMKAAWEFIKSTADTVINQYVSEKPVEQDPLPRLTTEMRRIRFGVSRVVSDPRNYRQRKYKRTPTSCRFTSDSGKYLVRKCSIVETSEDDQ